MPYGMTFKQFDDMATRLGEILGIDDGKVYDALKQITREEVARIAKNKYEEEDNGIQ